MLIVKHKSSGFTLIELIVVLSVAAVISLIGIASFVSYSQQQSINTAAADIANMFSLAKSRAASQVKPSSCSGALNGYRISIPDIASKTYQLDAVCSSGDSLILTNTLPSNISFGSANSTIFTFYVLTGGFTMNGLDGTIVLSGFGKSKTITVDSLGNVR
ncbi:MAG: hypothetical protein A3H50_00090 [Candidatus Levybacteria bacterium RIFCSPLOWO2_02_FULL_37_10]|nr:MAG: hypothetical protein A2860_01515 [Candidatus Levybacteria bacterium RIFCSPHIGHO2_01_FULL_37_33]OGH17627.1 MAG: hypothetical protein A3C97_02450 [Candidatus Levybacteria bacterium RIFCSPHIGHO2_02_FULL_37_11]OGH29331.1 MAG: hypothetical protein A3F30_02235 [Candidatus Levybacteria bacterium RIFCSPHIGHO2_12_FULL_37_12]OGH32453.1 MAG: hypothetical protein A2953_01690 [Candidatus Levybacteria bacterium RIFCSPLOWO2_01_FULL_36_54]OGH43264.1 MAG: hypothetical protein A3H50_00090 [Candidatus Lev